MALKKELAEKHKREAFAEKVGDEEKVARQYKRGKMDDFWDEDICILDMSDEEKNGLQVYRNYQKAFNTEAEKRFAAKVNSEEFQVEDLERLLGLIVVEDLRFLPVIVIGYSDDLLLAMFKRELDDDLVGKRSDLFGPFGPLSSFFNRLQLASAFQMLSNDVAKDLNKVRAIRNQVSHKWNIDVQGFLLNSELSELFPVDQLLAEREKSEIVIPDYDGENASLRIRLIWLAARFTYEATFFSRAKKQRLNPNSALYQENHPKYLKTISDLAMLYSRKVIAGSS